MEKNIKKAEKDRKRKERTERGGKRQKKVEKGQKKAKNIHSLRETRAEEFTSTPFLLCIITFRPEAEYKPTYATC